MQIVFRIAAVPVLAAVLLVLRASCAQSEQPAAAMVRAMWVWQPGAVYGEAQRSNFIKTAVAAKITDVLLYLRANDYIAHEAKLQMLLSSLANAGIRAWGMEGWRGYFSDVEGPGGLFAAADAMVAFNTRHSTIKFVGFHSDVEPQDGQDVGQALFHNEVVQSKLTPGQLADRDKLMGEWLAIHERLLAKMKAAGLQYGGAMPSWVDDYYGEPVQAVFRGERKPVLQHLMTVVPQYVIMSYNTNPSSLIKKIIGELDYAASFSGQPRVIFGIDTHAGAGVNVSYADTPPKNSKAAVMRDLAVIGAKLSADFPGSYLGWAIHDWEGWRDLPD